MGIASMTGDQGKAFQTGKGKTKSEHKRAVLIREIRGQARENRDCNPVFANPGYNRDRGPVIVPSVRMHIDL